MMQNGTLLALCLFAGHAFAEPSMPADGPGGRSSHLQYSAAMGMVAGSLNMTPARGLGACMAVGVIKEVGDYYKPSPGTRHGLFSRQDLAADAVGCLAGYVTGRGVRWALTRHGVGVSIPIN